MLCYVKLPGFTRSGAGVLERLCIPASNDTKATVYRSAHRGELAVPRVN